MTSNRITLNKMIEKCFKYFLSIAIVISVNSYFFETDNALYANSILNILFFVAALFLLNKALSVKDSIASKYALITAGMLALMLVFGSSISKYNDMREIFESISAFITSIFCLIGFTTLFYLGTIHLFTFARNQNDITADAKEISWFSANPKSFFICWVVLFLLWLPCFLAYYPGIFAYDIQNQIYQIFERIPYNTHHPVMHTLFVGMFLKLGKATGSNELGVVLYSITQMLCLSAVFSYALYYLAKIKLHLYVRLGILLYFALHPFNAIFSIVSSKDVMFTAFFVLLFIKLIDLCLDPHSFFSSKKKCITFVLVTFFWLALRNNALYAFCIFVPFLFIYLRKYWKKFLIILVCCIGLNMLYGSLLSNALDVEKGEQREALCVPMQQIARVYAEHSTEMASDDYNMILKFFPENLSDIYNPRFADYVKYYFNEDYYSDNQLEFFSLWIRLFFKYPSDYVSAFLSGNLGYWYTDAVQPDPYSGRMLIETYTCEYDDYLVQRDSKLPFLEKIYDSIALDSSMQFIPILALLFSTGFPIWLIFICMMILLIKKNRLYIIMIPLMAFWFTLMAGPVVNGRYIYPLFVLLPICVAIALSPQTAKIIKKKGKIKK